MRILIAILATALLALPLADTCIVGASAAEQGNFTAVPNRVLPARSDLAGVRRHVAEAACGLCSDTDCCGGASLGWKLCKDDCPSGQKKCMMVATCP